MKKQMTVSRTFAAVITAALLVAATTPSQAVVTLPGVYNSGAGYTNASSLPVSSTDVINGLAPVNNNYVGGGETAGGTTIPMTDGSTGVPNSAPTTAANALFDLGSGPQPWYLSYSLPASALGWSLTSVVTTTGHQDFRVNQHFDIEVSANNVNFISLSDGTAHTGFGLPGTGFQYAPSGGTGGAAQSTLGPPQSFIGAGGFVASNVKFIQFIAMNGGSDVFRELDVFGRTSPVPEPSTIMLLAIGGLGLAGIARRNRSH